MLSNLTLITEIRQHEDLNPTDQILLAEIWSYSKNGKPCFESNQTLASAVHVSVRAIAYALKRLESNGYITIEKKGTQHYIFVTDKITSTTQNNKEEVQKNDEGVQNLHSSSAKSALERVQKLHNTSSNNLPTKNTSSSYSKEQEKKEEEDFLNKCKEIDSISPASSHVAMYEQCVKRVIDHEEALATLRNAVKAGKRSPANFILTCIRNDNRLPLITLSSSSPSSPAHVERKQWEPATDEDKAHFEAYLAKCRAEEEGYEYAACN